MVLADWSLGVDALIIFPEDKEMPINISLAAEAASVPNSDLFIFTEIILLCTVCFREELHVFANCLVQRGMLIARHLMKKIFKCMQSIHRDIWLRSLLRKMVRIAFCAISAGLLLCGLYLSAYEDAKASVLVFSGVASTLFTTKRIFSDIQEVNKTVLIGVKCVAYVLFLGLYCLIFTEVWATGVYSVCLGKFLLEMMRDIQNAAVENSMSMRLRGSMFQRSSPSDVEFQQSLAPIVEILQGMRFDDGRISSNLGDETVSSSSEERLAGIMLSNDMLNRVERMQTSHDEMLNSVAIIQATHYEMVNCLEKLHATHNEMVKCIETLSSSDDEF